MSDSQHNDYGDPVPATTGYVALIGTIVFVLILLYLAAVYYNAEEAERITKFVEEPAVEYNANIESQMEQLSDYRYVHDYANETGRVTIPLDEARTKILEEWDGDPNSPEGVGSGTGAAADAAGDGNGGNTDDSESESNGGSNTTDDSPNESNLTGEQSD